jgi:hypothetical protein
MSDDGLIFNAQAIQQDEQRQWRLPQPKSATLDTIGAAFRAARDDQPTHLNEERINAYAQIANALQERGFPHSRYWNEWNRGYGDPIMISRIQADVDHIRAGAKAKGEPDPFPKLPKSWQEFDEVWPAQMRARQERDAQTIAHGGTVPWLIGTMAGGLTDLPTIASMAFGGGEARLATQIAREALVQGATELAQQPLINAERRAQGRPELTARESAVNIASAAALGAALPVAAHGAAAAARMVHDRLPAGLVINRAINGAELPPVTGADLAQAFEQAVPEHVRTPDQVDALHVVRRDTEMAGATPFTPDAIGDDAHVGAMDRAIGALAGIPQSRPRVTRPAGVDGYLAAVRRSESGGNPNARNPMPGQTASGLYGFTNKTWVGAYRAEFPNSGLSEQAMLARKGDPALQERLMRRLTTDNAERLRAMGMEATPANLYVMHHLGTGDGPKILRAGADTPLSDLLSERIIAANPHMRGKTVGEFREWAGRKMGQAPAEGEAFALRDDGGAAAAIDQERIAIEADRGAVDNLFARDDESGAMAAMAPDAAHAEPAPIEHPAGIEMSSAIPQLRRDLFADETSWRVAQARIDAEYLDLPEPMTTRQTVWDDARAELGAAREGGFQGALYHDEAGPIDVQWGDKEGGLARVMEAHPDLVEQLPQMLDDARVLQGGGNALHLESADGAVNIRLARDGEDQPWRLSDVQREAPAEPEASAAAAAERRGGAERGADAGRAAGSPESAAGERMADPGGADMKLEADRIWHDLDNSAEEDQRAFTLGDGDERSIAAAKEDFATEAMALQALKACL